MCCACCISEFTKERSAEKCCSPVDAGSPAISSFFRTKSTVTTLIQFPENASIHLSIQTPSNPLFTIRFSFCPCPHPLRLSYIHHSGFNSLSLHPTVFRVFVQISSCPLTVYLSVSRHIRLSAYRLSICLSIHPPVRLPFIYLSLDTSSCPLTVYLSVSRHIRLSAYRLSICLSTHLAVRPFSHSSFSLQSVLTSFILLSAHSYFTQTSVPIILSTRT